MFLIPFQGVKEFYEKVKNRQRKFHPVIIDGLSKVLMFFEMTKEVNLKSGFQSQKILDYHFR